MEGRVLSIQHKGECFDKELFNQGTIWVDNMCIIKSMYMRDYENVFVKGYGVVYNHLQ